MNIVTYEGSQEYMASLKPSGEKKKECSFEPSVADRPSEVNIEH